MKEIPDFRFKHHALMQDYHELQKETEFKMRRLEMMKQKRSALDAQVRFLRRRYEHLKQDQSLETSPNMLILSESGGGAKKNSSLKQKDQVCNDNASCDLETKNPKRSRGNEVLTNSTPLPDLNDNNVSNKVSGFDLNQLSREEEDPEANGEATNKAMVSNGINCEMKLPICRDVEKELSRAVKRKVSWQDPVALRV